MSTECVKAAVILCFLAVTFSLCNASPTNAIAKTHDLIVGTRQWGDVLLQSERVHKDYSWFRIVKETRTFPGDGFSKITQIKVLDQAHDGTGAFPAIVTGGTDNNFVTIKFTSQRSQPIDFVVQIYGKRS